MAPRRVIVTGFTSLPATSSIQIPNSRSNAIRLPSRLIDGHSTRPPLKLVSFLSEPPAVDGRDQRFSAPSRSDMKKIVRPSALHIGHEDLPLRAVSCA